MSMLLNAATVLDCLNDHQGGLTETEIRVKIGLPKATTHRLITTMVELRLLRRTEPRNEYVLGPALIRWGTTAINSVDLRSVAHPFLQELSVTTGETSHLGVLDGGSVLYLDIVDSPHAVRMSSRVGGTMPAYSTAMGKCFLAHLSIDERDRALAQPLVSRTANTITSRQVLVEQLERIPSIGYALEEGENEEGVSCVAAPIVDHRGNMVAAISVSTPGYRLARPDQHAAPLLETARLISSALGYVDAEDPSARDASPLTEPRGSQGNLGGVRHELSHTQDSIISQ